MSLEFSGRAPTFYRLLSHINTVTAGKADDEEGCSLLKELSDLILVPESDLAVHHLLEMLLEMNTGSALAVFPTEDLRVLERMILFLLKYYQRNPYVSAKIWTLCGAHTAVAHIGNRMGDGTQCPLVPARDQSRVMEIARLNHQLSDLAQKIKDVENPQVSVEFFKNKDHVFHPESQFIRVIVS